MNLDLADMVSLPEVASRLGLHRATVNHMVLEGRLRGYRLGAHWFVRSSELEIFERTYERPKSSPRRVSGGATEYWLNHIVRWLLLWDSATCNELDRVLDLQVGNIRKYLLICEQEGLATRDDAGYWSLTEIGRQRASALPPAGVAEEG